MRLRLVAPAKVNWTLEVLGKRPDDYHEVRTVLQTVALADSVVLAPADRLSLRLWGEAGPLAREPAEANLAWRAAHALQERADVGWGATIELEKRIPVAAGLGGGSSDAAAVLRGLNRLWGLGLSTNDLREVAAGLGSDVPFFLTGGTALARGRGELVTFLPDAPPQRLLLAWPAERLAGKTARLSSPKTMAMYAALRPEHQSDGRATARLAERLSAGQSVRDRDIVNIFEAVLAEVMPAAARALEMARGSGLPPPHLVGSGPALLFLLGPAQPAEPLLASLRALGLAAVETGTLAAAEATAWTEVA